MTGASIRDRRGGWPLGLIGMLALVVVAERYVAGRGNGDFGTLYTLEWGFQGRSIKPEAPKAQLLCFGTSLTRLGVSPIILADRLGFPAYNFAMSGAQPYAIYTAFRHALEAGAKPRAVVVDFKWSSIALPPTFNERVLPEVATLAECAELAYAVQSADFLARLMLVKLLPSYRCRAVIRDNISAAVDGREPVRNYENFITIRNTRVNRGAMHASKTKYDGKIEPADAALYPASWSCDPVCEAYIHKFLGLAEARGIQVFWLLPPISPAAESLREEIGAELAYTRFVKATTSRYPGVSVIDARGSGYPAEVFFDPTHLNRYGAATLSADLADAIADRFERPEREPGFWVGLRSYRPNARVEQLEDIKGSIAFFDENRKKSARR
jgi:hypothetical protein